MINNYNQDYKRDLEIRAHAVYLNYTPKYYGLRCRIVAYFALIKLNKHCLMEKAKNKAPLFNDRHYRMRKSLWWFLTKDHEVIMTYLGGLWARI